MAGRTYSFGAGGRDAYLIKTNSTGDTLWTRTYGGSEWDEAHSVQQTTDGGYIVAGYAYSFGAGEDDFYLIKTDSLGDTLWTRTYGGSNQDAGKSVQQTTDGGYIVSGYTKSFGAGDWDAYLIKTDSSGDTLWIRTFGGSGFDCGYSVQQTTDGGYIVAVYTTSFGAGSFDFMLTMLDSLGNTCIGEFVSSTVMSEPCSITSPATVMDIPATTVNSPPTIVTSPATEITTVCEEGIPVEPVPVCKAFLTSRRINVSHGQLTRPAPGDNGNWRHDFKIHIMPCEPMNVSVGDSADVFVDVDTSGTFDEDENYLAIVSSTDLDSQATDIAIKVYIGEDLIDNDPCVAIYSINNIPIVDTLGNQIDYLCLDTFNPHDGGKSHVSGTPKNITLTQNYPNPFNPVTSIQFAVVSDQFSVPTTLKIYNIRGQLVRTLMNEAKIAGTYEVVWDGKDDRGEETASGVYFYKIKAGDYTETRKMILMK